MIFDLIDRFDFQGKPHQRTYHRIHNWFHPLNLFWIVSWSGDTCRHLYNLLDNCTCKNQCYFYIIHQHDIHRFLRYTHLHQYIDDYWEFENLYLDFKCEMSWNWTSYKRIRRDRFLVVIFLLRILTKISDSDYWKVWENHSLTRDHSSTLQEMEHNTPTQQKIRNQSGNLSKKWTWLKILIYFYSCVWFAQKIGKGA